MKILIASDLHGSVAAFQKFWKMNQILKWCFSWGITCIMDPATLTWRLQSKSHGGSNKFFEQCCIG